jgi:hypothetical protein
VGHEGLVAFDNMLRSAVSNLTNCSLSDNKWTESELPIRDGGLGIRRISSLALPAFLAAAAGSLLLQGSILSNVTLLPDSFMASLLPIWSASLGILPPDQPLPGKQSFRDRPGILAEKAMVEALAC